MRYKSLQIAAVCAVSATLAFSAGACSMGNGDKKAACDKLQQTITDVSKKGMTQISDPAGLEQTYANGAADLRKEGKDSGDDAVEKAADHAATAMANLGLQMKALTSGTTPQAPNTSDLVTAGTELKSACDG